MAAHHIDYHSERQARLDALDWASDMILRLKAVVAAQPDNRQARADATLIAEALGELIFGREPRSVVGYSGRFRAVRAPTPEEEGRVRQLWGMREQIVRAPAARRRRSKPPDDVTRFQPIRDGLTRRQRQAAETWAELVRLADLRPSEAEALKLHRGMRRSLEETAQTLGVSVGTARRRIESAARKLQDYVASRQWGSLDQFIDAR